MHDKLYDLALILVQGSDGMDTDLADEELAKQMSVKGKGIPITGHEDPRGMWMQGSTYS